MAGTTQGPIDRDGLVALFRKGTLTPQVEVSDGGTEWFMAPQVPGLMEEVFEGTEKAPEPPKGDPGSRFATAPNRESSQGSSRPGMSSDLAGPGSVAPSQSPAPASQAPTQSAATNRPSASVAEQKATEETQPDLGARVKSAAEPSSGPVGHIVLNTSAHQRRRSVLPALEFIKTAACGLVGLAAIIAIGLFAAYKGFGIDLRPALVDDSVSKFMIENPEIVAHVDLESILQSKVLRRTGIDSNPKLPYLQDAKNVIIVSDSLDLTAPRFLAIIDLKRDYRAEFIANLFRKGSTNSVGPYQMHTDPSGVGGVPLAACLPSPRTLLVGSPYVLRSVLERNDYPKLSPRESELVAAITGREKSASIGMFFDSIEGMISKAKTQVDEQLDQLDKEQRKMMADYATGPLKMIGEVDYAVKNIKHLTIEVDMANPNGRIEARTEAECINPWKAKKVVRILKDLIASAPSAGTQLDSLQSSLPVANGSTIEGTASFDPREFGDAFTAGLAKQGL